jgi:DNA-binding MltR family transcriptional regulator
MEYIEKHQFQDIQTLLDIRNLFAHTHEQQSFENKEIDEKCRNLNLSSMLKIEDVAEASRSGHEAMLKTPKIRFSMACTTICNHLLYDNV